MTNFDELFPDLPSFDTGDCGCKSNAHAFADELMESTKAALKALTALVQNSGDDITIEASKAILGFAVSMTMFGVGEEVDEEEY